MPDGQRRALGRRLPLPHILLNLRGAAVAPVDFQSIASLLTCHDQHALAGERTGGHPFTREGCCRQVQNPGAQRVSGRDQ